MKRIKTYVVLAGMMAIALTVQAEQNTPPADPAFTNSDAVSEQSDQVLDTQDNTAAPVAEEAGDAEAAKYDALYAALRDEETAPTDQPLETEAEMQLAAAGDMTDTNAMATSEMLGEEGSESMTNEAAVTESVVEDVAVMEEVETMDTDETTGSLVNSEQATVVIPLIVMDEVPLMDAIRNLARQAEINYMVDPKVPYGQVGEDGTVTPQPILSIRWENVTAEQALVAVLNNYNLQMIEDPKAKIYRVTVRDPAAPDPLVTKIIQLKYASPSNVVAAVQSTFEDRRSKVVADVRTSQIVVVATEKELASVEEMIEQLDTPTRQVLIEGRIIETTANPKTVKGIDWTGTLAGQRVKFGNGTTSGYVGQTRANATGDTAADVPVEPFITGITPGEGKTFAESLLTDIGTGGLSLDTARGLSPSTFFLDADGVSATISFLNTHADSKEIATPRAVTLDNESARLAVTRAFPIFKNTAGTQGSPGGSEVTYTNLGIILDVTPRISANDTINLKVVPEVSSIFDTVERVVASTVNQADVYDIRKIETRVLIPSGNTLVMGGLLRDRTRNGNVKVPILGDLPVFGLLFRQDSKERDKINLMVFITPTIVEDSDFQPTPTDFLKTKFEEPEDKPWGAWDSGKPKDWSLRKDK